MWVSVVKALMKDGENIFFLQVLARLCEEQFINTVRIILSEMSCLKWAQKRKRSTMKLPSSRSFTLALQMVIILREGERDTVVPFLGVMNAENDKAGTCPEGHGVTPAAGPRNNEKRRNTTSVLRLAKR
jgi:hypothetical protein